MTKFERLVIPSVGEGIEELELLYIAAESVKWYNEFGKLVSGC